VRGEEFSQVTVQNVLFGSTPASAFTVVSPTEIRATYPDTLPKGHHNVKLQSGFAARSFADLAVVDAATFSAEFLDYPDTLRKAPNAIVYDAERAAVAVSVCMKMARPLSFDTRSSMASGRRPSRSRSSTISA
jgi:hypothetical protein